MQKNASDSITTEKRSEPRSTKLRDYRVEIKFVGEPIYQFRVTDVSTKGAGVAYLIWREKNAVGRS